MRTTLLARCSLALVLAPALANALAAQNPAAPEATPPPPPPAIMVVNEPSLIAPAPPQLPASTTLDARRAAVHWLKQCQAADGSWDGDAFLGAGARCEGPATTLDDAGVTGLALLALLADGSTMRVGPHRDTVRRATIWLRDRQQVDGTFSTAPLEQALAAAAMTETYRLSDYKLLRKSSQLGLTALARHRGELGLLRAGDERPSIEVTAWASTANVAGSAAGLAVPGQPSSADVAAQAKDLPPAPAALAHTLLLLGGELSQPGVREPVQVVAQTLPQWRAGRVDVAAWWHAVHVARRAEAGPWNEWRQALSHTAFQGQRIDGDYAGSWDPLGGDLGGGRVATTALMVLTLAAAEADAPR